MRQGMTWKATPDKVKVPYLLRRWRVRRASLDRTFGAAGRGGQSPKRMVVISGVAHSVGNVPRRTLDHSRRFLIADWLADRAAASRCQRVLVRAINGQIDKKPLEIKLHQREDFGHDDQDFFATLARWLAPAPALLMRKQQRRIAGGSQEGPGATHGEMAGVLEAGRRENAARQSAEVHEQRQEALTRHASAASNRATADVRASRPLDVALIASFFCSSIQPWRLASLSWRRDCLAMRRRPHLGTAAAAPAQNTRQWLGPAMGRVGERRDRACSNRAGPPSTTSLKGGSCRGFQL